VGQLSLAATSDVEVCVNWSLGERHGRTLRTLLIQPSPGVSSSSGPRTHGVHDAREIQSRRGCTFHGESRYDRGRLFIELTSEALADLRREFVERAVPTKETWWGYDTLQVDDPDGNELFFRSPD
jgi:hypothetical protein